LVTVLTEDCGVLDLFRAVWARFHRHLGSLILPEAWTGSDGLQTPIDRWIAA
jgi:hypothetical protein